MKVQGKDGHVLIAIVVMAALFPVTAVGLSGLFEGPQFAGNLTRDLAAVAGLNPFYGGLSSLGAFLWFGSGALLLFAAATSLGRAPRMQLGFLASGALLSFYLWFDDFFMFHDELVEKYLGLHDEAVYAALAIATLSYLFYFRRQILRTGYLWLGAAFVFLGLSVAYDVVVDLITDHPNDWSYVVEDSLKWVGIVCWARYQAGTAYAFTRAQILAENSVERGDTPVAAALQELRQRWTKAKAA